MSQSPRPLAEDGSRDCGRFYVDVMGGFTPADLNIEWSDRPRQGDHRIAEHVDAIWSRELDRSRTQDVILYDGPLCRLDAFNITGSRLTLHLSRTSFKEFLGTNLTRADIQHRYGSSAMANPLGVSAGVATSDGFLVLARRSRHVIHHGGRIHTLGGILEPPREAGVVPDPFAAVRKELLAEMNLSAEQIQDVLCLGLVRERKIAQPELVFDVTARIEAHDLTKQTATAPEAVEHANLVMLADYPASTTSFLEKHLEELTPVATAWLLLHGLRRWGSGWFASTRGYLQSVI